MLLTILGYSYSIDSSISYTAKQDYSDSSYEKEFGDGKEIWEYSCGECPTKELNSSGWHYSEASDYTMAS